MRRSGDLPDVLYCVNRESAEGAGEDSWCYEALNGSTLIGVFDGSGGIGSRRYENFSGNTGAYIAARAVSGAAQEWFIRGRKDGLRKSVDDALAVCKKYADKDIGLKGTMKKDFPTTLAMMTAERTPECINARCYWAGDSRCYLYDRTGLHQLTQDDVDSEDPMANLSDDGVLLNVVNASIPFSIHEKKLSADTPCLLIAATDGCFGYLPSPMHFEYLILEALMQADSISDWKTNIDDALHRCAGDDYSMCVAGFGYDSFDELKANCREHRDFLYQNYISSKSDLKILWEAYRNNYMKYCGEQENHERDKKYQRI